MFSHQLIFPSCCCSYFYNKNYSKLINICLEDSFLIKEGVCNIPTQNGTIHYWVNWIISQITSEMKYSYLNRNYWYKNLSVAKTYSISCYTQYYIENRFITQIKYVRHISLWDKYKYLHRTHSVYQAIQWDHK